MKKSLIALVAVLVLVLILGIATVVALVNQQQENDALQTQVNDLTTQLQEATTNTSEQTGTNSTNTTNNTTPTGTNGDNANGATNTTDTSSNGASGNTSGTTTGSASSGNANSNGASNAPAALPQGNIAATGRGDDRQPVGTVYVSGYAQTPTRQQLGLGCAPGVDPSACSPQDRMLQLTVLQSANDAVLREFYPDSSDARGSVDVRLGCVENGRITYESGADEFLQNGNDGIVREFTLSQALSSQILNSSANNPVQLKLERKSLTLGFGGPSCYSEFAVVEAVR